MRKILILLLVVSVCMPGLVSAKDYKGKRIDMYNRRHYRVALNATNPLSAFQKYGGQLEIRHGNVSDVFSYTKYIGAYPGTQYSFEIQKYLRTHSRDQYYIYFRGLFGDAGFDSRKLSIYGDNSKILIGTFDEGLNFKSGNAYGGGAFGFGRRYNYNVLFIRWNFGFRACGLLPAPEDKEKHMYRLMYVTGPASIIEFNLHVGLQI